MTPVDLILSRLDNPKRRGKGWIARCPAHEDRNPSLSISEGDDGRALLHCFADCTPQAIVEAAGLTMADLMPDTIHNPDSRTERKGKPKIVATYGYCNESGELLYQAVRYMPKGFRQRRPDGKGDWIWNMQDVRRVLYRLPEMLERPDVPVWIVEGEKDVEALRARGFVATCNVGGAGKWRPEYNEHLRGRTVYIIPDNDKPGRKHAQQVAEALQGVAESVRIVRLPTAWSASHD